MNEQKNIVQFEGFKRKIIKDSRKSKILPLIKFNGSKLISCLNLVFKVAPLNLTVLVVGESGVGKENIVRLIHEQSSRAEKELVVVDCSSITESLLTSSIFGHKKGSFTGAFEDKDGYFKIADGGTVFLDEIGELPLSTQKKLLRFLQEGTFTAVGDTKEQSVDIRIIAATNKNLEQEVVEGRFRKDLFYRLDQFPINIPPLRERSEDIPLLIDYFKDLFLDKINLNFVSISQETIKVLQQYHWPGNVRELKNIVERLMVIYGDDGEILPEHLDKEIRKEEVVTEKQETIDSLLSVSDESGLFIYKPITYEDYDKVATAITLFETHGVQVRAGDILKASRRTMCERVKKHAINPKDPLSSIEHLKVEKTEK